MRLDDDDAAINQMVAAGVDGGRRTRQRFNLLSIAGLLAMPERGYLLKGIMAPGELSCWWGPPKCGKSFLLMHVAYALSQGRSTFGRRVRKCQVLYLACEGRSGLRGRVEALQARFGGSENFTALAEPLDLWQPGDTESLVEIIQARRFDLVVVDTVNRVLAGGDENSSADMGALIRNLDRIRADTGAHVAMIHHGTKAGGNGPRGHGSLLGAVDAGIEVTVEEDGTRSARLDAMKDDARGAIGFRLKVIDLGDDEDGDRRTTCLVEEIDTGDARPAGKRLTPTEEAWMHDLHDMFTSGWAEEKEPIGGQGAYLTLTRDRVREEFRVRGRFSLTPDGNLTGADRERLRAMLNSLKNKGKIGLNADLVWVF